MSTVKIFLDPNETTDQAEANLYKALGFHVTGEAHAADQFSDPATNQVASVAKTAHEKMYEEMLVEIFAVLDEDFTRGNQ